MVSAFEGTRVSKRTTLRRAALPFYRFLLGTYASQDVESVNVDGHR